MSPLVPIAVGAFVVLFAVALVREARRQRAARSALVRDFATRHGLAFQEGDAQGAARAFAEGLSAIGVFYSPSLGKREPRNVVRGSRAEGEFCLFQHAVRITEGHVRHYTVCVFRMPGRAGGALLARFPRGGRAPDSEAAVGRSVAAEGVEVAHVQGEAADTGAARRLLEPETARALAEAEAALPFRVELQVRGDRVAAYLAQRNAEPGAPEELERLVDFAALAARRLAAAPGEA